MKKVAVYSGGGSWGACGGGMAEQINGDYKAIFGVSTGGLLMTLAILRKFEMLKEAYTNVNQRDIFNVNPFNRKGHISTFRLIKALISGNNTLGKTENLRNLIRKFYTIEEHREIRKQGREIFACVLPINKNPSVVEYRSSNDFDYEEMVDWIWSGANVPGVASISNIGGIEYGDAGLVMTLPLVQAVKYASENNVKEIDCIIHTTRKNFNKIKPETKNLKHLVNRIFNANRFDTIMDDIEHGVSLAKGLSVVKKINLYWLPKKLNDNSLMFDSDDMRSWWRLGKWSVIDGGNIDIIKI